MKFLVTGGAGFIGSALIRHILATTDYEVVNVDRLTYAGNLENLKSIADNPRYRFACGDICDRQFLEIEFQACQPDLVIHLAAESHVDRSIDAADDFVQTNVLGTVTLLEVARQYWMQLPLVRQSEFRFHHVSTDEVFGDLGQANHKLFNEASAYRPSSPYSASKAASDHFVRAWSRTFGLPIVITNCSNNYGPYQFPEKLIPMTILNALEGKPLPVYGDGEQIRDWLYVDDHAEALLLVAKQGKIGATYNIGGLNEQKNISVVQSICDLLEMVAPNKPGSMKAKGLIRYRDLIEYVADRPGHDRRYAIDASYIQQQLSWRPRETFQSGLQKTIQWYMNNQWWWRPIRDGHYAGKRLGGNANKLSGDGLD